MIPLMKSAFYNEPVLRKKLAKFVLTTPQFSMGKEVEKFEKEFAKWHERKHAVMVNSGSSANLLLLQSLKNLGLLITGDQIGASSLTWATNVMPILQLGYEPVLLDVTLDTFNVPPRNVRGIPMRALFITHLLGLSDDIVSIQKYCEENNIILLEDTCESLGSRVDGKLLGNFGLASTFSFFVAHHLSTIEGGMVCTDDDKLADTLKMTRAHGWARNLPAYRRLELQKNFGIEDFYEKYTAYSSAFNFRPTEIQGFLGNEQLPFLNGIVRRREEIFLRFMDALDERMYIPLFSHMDLVSSYGMPVVYKKETDAIEARKRISQKVEIRPIFSGDIQRQPFYPVTKREETNAHKIHRQGFFVGICPEYTDEEVDEIISAIHE